MTTGIRRTTTLEMQWLPAPTAPGAHVRLTATGTDETAAGAVDRAALTGRIGADRVLLELATEPALPGVAGLAGRPAAAGFRAAAHELGPTGVLAQLLDDVPTSMLVAYYAVMRAGWSLSKEATRAARSGPMRDVCAGWATDGPVSRGIAATGLIPMPGVVETPLSGPPVPPGAIRRTRRLDVQPGDVTRVSAWFRDSFATDTGVTGALHEWSVAAEVDRAGLVTHLGATPHVLPYDACPLVAPRVVALVGRPVGDLAGAVSEHLAGTSGCTHLNDLLRSLRATPELASRVR